MIMTVVMVVVMMKKGLTFNGDDDSKMSESDSENVNL